MAAVAAGPGCNSLGRRRHSRMIIRSLTCGPDPWGHDQQIRTDLGSDRLRLCSRRHYTVAAYFGGQHGPRRHQILNTSLNAHFPKIFSVKICQHRYRQQFEI